jgi:hypothetical protein
MKYCRFICKGSNNLVQSAPISGKNGFASSLANCQLLIAICCLAISFAPFASVAVKKVLLWLESSS